MAPCRPQFFRLLSPQSLQQLPIPSKFAQHLLEGGAEGRPTVAILSPLGKFCQVELHRDGSEMMFRRGWPEFVSAYGLLAGFLLVFRYEGNMVFTLKVFDLGRCRRDFNTTEVLTEKSPFVKKQFYNILSPDCLEKLRIPSQFTQDVTTTNCGHGTATLFTPLGKFWHIEFHRDGSDIIFGRDWSGFIRAYAIAIDSVLLFSYEGNMVFRVKVFGSSGCLKDFKVLVVRTSPGVGLNTANLTPSSSRVHDNEEEIRGPSCSMKRKNQMPKVESPCHVQHNAKIKRASSISSGQGAKAKKSHYYGAPLHRYEKKIKFDRDKYSIALPKKFCSSIGLLKNCKIILESSKQGSWQVNFGVYEHSRFLLSGWLDFFAENKIKIGDRCIFTHKEKNVFDVQVVRSGGKY